MGIEEDGDGNDQADDNKEHFAGGSARKLEGAAKVVCLVFHALHNERAKAIVIVEGELDVPASRQINHGRNCFVSDLRQGVDGGMNEMSEAVCQGGYDNQENYDGGPFRPAFREMELRQGKVSEQGSYQRSGEVETASQNQCPRDQ